MNFIQNGILYIINNGDIIAHNESIDIIIQFGAYILLSRVKLSPFVVSIDLFIA